MIPLEIHFVVNGCVSSFSPYHTNGFEKNDVFLSPFALLAFFEDFATARVRFWRVTLLQHECEEGKPLAGLSFDMIMWTNNNHLEHYK